MNDHQIPGYRLEQAAFNAWLPAQTIILNGWVVRLDSGYTGRANSVTPQGIAIPPFEAKVAHCEQLYRGRGLAPMFRLTTLENYSDLDDFLARRSYIHTSPTTVMIAPCTGAMTPLVRTLTLDEWLPLYDGHSMRVSPAAHHAILKRITTPCMFASLEVDGASVAVGLGVLADDLFGLFDIVVTPDARGRGHGRALLQGMLAWGREHGAITAYLQVTVQNTAARRLYDSLGFRDVYQYHYRK